MAHNGHVHVKKNIPLQFPNIVLPSLGCVPVGCDRCGSRHFFVVVKQDEKHPDVGQIREIVCATPKCSKAFPVDDQGRLEGKHEIKNSGAGRIA